MLEDKSEIELAAKKFKYLADGAPLSNVLYGYPSQRRLWHLAAKALRETVERDKGCDYCNERNMPLWWNNAGHPTSIMIDPKHCPNCGRKLTKESKE